MRKISEAVKKRVAARPDKCQRAKDGFCDGRITWEHAIIFGGRQVDAAWAIVKLCERHHAVGTWQDRGDLDKEKNVFLALSQASDEELKTHSKAIDYLALRDRLYDKYKYLL